MIIFLIKLCILSYLFYMIYRVHSMVQYDSKATVKTIQIPDKDKIMTELSTKQPLLIIYPENKLDMNIQNLCKKVPGYIIKEGDTLISLDQLTLSPTFEVIDNEQIIDDYELNDYSNEIFGLIKEVSSCDNSYKLTLYKGDHQSPLYKNYRERLLLQPLDKPYVLYLFNPKHETEIKGLELNQIKKWGIKLEIAKDTIVSIPTEWSYFYESNDELILLKVESDTLSTWLFNRIRRK